MIIHLRIRIEKSMLPIQCQVPRSVRSLGAILDLPQLIVVKNIGQDLPLQCREKTL